MDYIGHGIYTYKEASHLTGISVVKLRRWIEGYKRNNSGNIVLPLVDSDY